MTTERNTKNTSSDEKNKGPRQPVSLWQWFPKAMKEELQKSKIDADHVSSDEDAAVDVTCGKA
jgi:hypothetical protein